MLLPLKDACKALSISYQFGYTLVQQGKLPHVRMGRRILVIYAELQEVVDRMAAEQCPSRDGGERRDGLSEDAPRSDMAIVQAAAERPQQEHGCDPRLSEVQAELGQIHALLHAIEARHRAMQDQQVAMVEALHDLAAALSAASSRQPEPVPHEQQMPTATEEPAPGPRVESTRTAGWATSSAMRRGLASPDVPQTHRRRPA